jgi:hypothetical protein
MSFAVQLASDFVSTPYVLRQRHGTRVNPPPVMLKRKEKKNYAGSKTLPASIKE